MKYDWKKTEKQYYKPDSKPRLIKVPQFKYFAVAGQGDPNNDSFQEYISVLYSLSYAVKMWPARNQSIPGYFDYVVYPLEGVWDLKENAKGTGSFNKSDLVFNLMIRQPDFVTGDHAQEVIELTKKKKNHPLLNEVRFHIDEDGDSIQMMHTGSFDAEPVSFKKMDDFCEQNGYSRVSKSHREIYLSDFRKVPVDNLKTILRYKVFPVKKLLFSPVAEK